eukprot:COSAG02_NODE_11_length_58539_cov_103.119473_28_plen_120_part_00
MLKKATGLGVMLVGKGGAAGERGGASACSSGSLQLGGVRGRGRYAGAAAAVGGGGRTGGTRGLLRRVGSQATRDESHEPFLQFLVTIEDRIQPVAARAHPHTATPVGVEAPRKAAAACS